jgi:hypothetical protein
VCIGAGRDDPHKHYRSISAESLLGFARKIKYADKVEKRMAKELGL